MRILVTGATSGLGRNAAQYLIEQGFDVVATGRNLQEGQWLKQAGATFIALDLTQATPEDFNKLIAGCDAIWHCAAKSSPWGDKASFHDINVRVTQKLAETAGKLGVPRFIHISTPAIYFDFQHHYNVPETYLARAFSSEYASSKYQAEQDILAAAARFDKTTFVMLRPRGLFGPHDNVIIPRLIQQLSRDNHILRLPRRGEALLELTFVQNVVYAMELATCNHTLKSGSVYNITNQQPQRLVDMLDALLHRQLNLNYQVKSVPWPVLSCVARGMEWVGKYVDKEPRVTRYSAGTVCFDMTLNSEKAITELNYHPRYSLDEGIALTGEWLRTHGKNYGI